MPVTSDDDQDLADLINDLENAARPRLQRTPPIDDILPESRSPIPDELRGPSGRMFRDSMQIERPVEVPPFMNPYPDWRQERGNFENRLNDPPYKGTYLDSKALPWHTPEQQAILQVLDKRLDYRDPFENQIPPPAPAGSLEAAVGANDLERSYGQFKMPDQSRDKYLSIIDIADAAGVQGSIPDKRRMPPPKGGYAEDMVEDAIAKSGSPEWEGNTHPTQKDIDLIMENPTDHYLDSFEEQFGEGTVEKYMDQRELDTGKSRKVDFPNNKVPMPRPRVRHTEGE
jgi:hypothetical protein